MRLAQAARKLSMTTEEIVDFLQLRGIEIEKDSNTKLSAESIQVLYKYFEIEEEEPVEKVEVQPDEIQDEQADANIPTEEEAEVNEEIVSEKLGQEESNEIAEPQQEEKVEEVQASEKKSFKTVGELLESEDETTDEDLVIKAPKVELKGLNVVGKIDLPEPKPKEEKQEDKPDKLQPRVKKNYQKGNNKKSRRNRKELTPAQIRQKEEEREERKRKRIEKEKKKKREEFYKENILKPKQEEQKKKTKKKKIKVVEQKIQPNQPKPKTVLGKFWRWLNT
ncbi:hypothetical protein QYS48_28825 [Marivirga arenosa]|uniref:Translation initiation factor IF-2 n=1 Tax=Marivirga arenosa TaxID=3059076 RepID=A0AA51RDN2_9BACT|nr:hypothetical protein [Marivirga sp. ABR2-2]WMN07460.1 hypothetical protein QYS48_28825 [Marivirga sp. ABR2-2]